MDVGSFTAALEYACDTKAEVVGKPSATFFQAALNDMGLQPEEVSTRNTILLQTFSLTFYILNDYPGCNGRR